MVSNLMWHQFIVAPGGPGSTTGHGDNGRARQGVQCWTQLSFKTKASTFRGSSNQRSSSPSCGVPGRPHLYGALVVMGHIQEHGVCDGGHQWAETGLDEGSDWLAPVAVHQTTLLVAVARRHGLWTQGSRWDWPGPRHAKQCITSHTQPVGGSATRQLQAFQCYMHLDEQGVNRLVTRGRC